ncbi:MAG: hypothetical protein ACR2P5_08450, partial [Gammaproteobacteria bacterium]
YSNYLRYGYAGEAHQADDLPRPAELTRNKSHAITAREMLDSFITSPAGFAVIGALLYIAVREGADGLAACPEGMVRAADGTTCEAPSPAGCGRAGMVFDPATEMCEGECPTGMEPFEFRCVLNCTGALVRNRAGICVALDQDFCAETNRVLVGSECRTPCTTTQVREGANLDCTERRQRHCTEDNDKILSEDRTMCETPSRDVCVRVGMLFNQLAGACVETCPEVVTVEDNGVCIPTNAELECNARGGTLVYGSICRTNPTALDCYRTQANGQRLALNIGETPNRCVSPSRARCASLGYDYSPGTGCMELTSAAACRALATASGGLSFVALQDEDGVMRCVVACSDSAQMVNSRGVCVDDHAACVAPQIDAGEYCRNLALDDCKAMTPPQFIDADDGMCRAARTENECGQVFGSAYTFDNTATNNCRERMTELECIAAQLYFVAASTAGGTTTPATCRTPMEDSECQAAFGSVGAPDERFIYAPTVGNLDDSDAFRICRHRTTADCPVSQEVNSAGLCEEFTCPTGQIAASANNGLSRVCVSRSRTQCNRLGLYWDTAATPPTCREVRINTECPAGFPPRVVDTRGDVNRCITQLSCTGGDDGGIIYSGLAEGIGCYDEDTDASLNCALNEIGINGACLQRDAALCAAVDLYFDGTNCRAPNNISECNIVQPHIDTRATPNTCITRTDCLTDGTAWQNRCYVLASRTCDEDQIDINGTCRERDAALCAEVGLYFDGADCRPATTPEECGIANNADAADYLLDIRGTTTTSRPCVTKTFCRGQQGAVVRDNCQLSDPSTCTGGTPVLDFARGICVSDPGGCTNTQVVRNGACVARMQTDCDTMSQVLAMNSQSCEASVAACERISRGYDSVNNVCRLPESNAECPGSFPIFDATAENNCRAIQSDADCFEIGGPDDQLREYSGTPGGSAIACRPITDEADCIAHDQGFWNDIGECQIAEDTEQCRRANNEQNASGILPDATAFSSSYNDTGERCEVRFCPDNTQVVIDGKCQPDPDLPGN